MECKNLITTNSLIQLERTYQMLLKTSEDEYAPFRTRPVFKVVAGTISGKEGDELLLMSWRRGALMYFMRLEHP